VVARKDPKALYELAPGTPGLAGVVLLHQMEGFIKNTASKKIKKKSKHKNFTITNTNIIS